MRHSILDLSFVLYYIQDNLQILIKRLRPLLDKLVSPVHSAFIAGRAMHNNMFLTHEIMHKFKKRKGKSVWVALKLDMEKAYDGLEWDFMQKCLEQYGFHSVWMGLWNV